MMNWGRVALGTVIPFMFTTYDGATGASEEGSGLAVTDIEIYKAGGGLTQRSSDAGYALLDADGHALDSIVGLAGFSVDTGDNTDAGFFVAGGYYIVVVASVTVDAQTVNFIAGTFSLGPALSVAGVEEVDVTHWGGTAIGSTVVRSNIIQVEGTDATDYFDARVAVITAILGALNDAAADGEVTTTDTLVAYIKQLINILIGAAGIVSWPAAAAPGNGVSIAEALRAVYDDSNELQTDWADGGRLDLLLDAVLEDTGTTLPGLLATIDTVVDAVKAVTDLFVAAHAEPTGVPAADETPLDKLAYVFMALRNRVDVTATKKTFYDDGGAAEWEKDLSDDGTTYSESEGNAI